MLKTLINIYFVNIMVNSSFMVIYFLCDLAFFWNSLSFFNVEFVIALDFVLVIMTNNSTNEHSSYKCM